MIARAVVDVALTLAVIVAAGSTLGVVVMPSVEQRLHFLGPVSLFGPALVLVALAADGAPGEDVAKTVVIVVAVAAMNAVISHATARAVRVRALERREEARP
ncbi:MAG TPA: monovalent cation/H(+) antiporter subunit G [Minicystis sp.]|nr:monovalent cation/H(+) antiporter subunit G [Minicystis sp.]